MPPIAKTTDPISIAVADCLPGSEDSPIVEDSRTKGTTDANPSGDTRRVIGTATATLLVVASMVGTGIFTTTGLLLETIHSTTAILVAWCVGGLVALFGALSYAELVASFPRNGGEYQLLGKIFHPAVGFVAGWVSLIVGFSAPIAASAIAFGIYFSAVMPSLNPIAAAMFLIIVLSIVHAARVTLGSGLQNIFTLAKVTVVLAFVGGGIFFGQPEFLARDTISGTFSAIGAPGFAVGLIFVAYAYSGWNGAAYIAGEVRNPTKSLPRALFLGTAIVTLLYLGLNVVFLVAAPPEALVGRLDVGTVAAESLFGKAAGQALSGVIALLLVSSVSAMMMAGPRVYGAIGEDYRCFSFLTKRGKNTGPVYAIALQAFAAIIMLLTASFDTLLTYIGFTLSLSAGLTVIGLFVLRKREPDLDRPYKCWGYPVTPILFIMLSCWMVVFTLWEAPIVAISGLGTIASGLTLYAIVRNSAKEGITER